ncbi:hypothetical protein RND71_016378 [Anisodus tanguticus]|uniref:KIB1-4 beta-propeller domain-containing protein n=1 Tax=Anisodus tanguticus TaxID=243964 RepID=A0AAE1VM46_9SOLA|nr:hypothetical protein RND71_016378 [Anisodus tanguticus]
MAIGIGDHLFYLTSGDEKWTRLEDFSRRIADIIVYKGNFYVVDQYGETIKYDPSLFNETKISSTLKYDSNKILAVLRRKLHLLFKWRYNCGHLGGVAAKYYDDDFEDDFTACCGGGPIHDY